MRRCCLNSFEVKHKDAKVAAEEKTGAEEDLATEAWRVGNSWAELRDCGTKGQDEKNYPFIFILSLHKCLCVCLLHVN